MQIFRVLTNVDELMSRLQSKCSMQVAAQPGQSPLAHCNCLHARFPKNTSIYPQCLSRAEPVRASLELLANLGTFKVQFDAGFIVNSVLLSR